MVRSIKRIYCRAEPKLIGTSRKAQWRQKQEKGKCLRKSLCGGGKWDVIVLNGPDARGSNADPLKALLAEPILAANSRRLYV
ncbi:hypothetical protein EAG_00967 [Camponotus floridanus]|uniref:Uncharacterized protein n=1 Tax=Camponotus floridanus TaxID=104421 RepID=E2B254_CAMFO|nr:hypothetical protein EAG_00967 [Camponotus floridanus]